MAKEVGSKILWESELKSLKEEFEGVRQDKTQDSQQEGEGFMVCCPAGFPHKGFACKHSNSVTCVLLGGIQPCFHCCE